MATPHFPVPASALKANIQVMPIENQTINIGELQVSTMATNHPGGGCAYRVDSDQGSFAYITDNELAPPEIPTTSYNQWVEFISGIDLFLHDAMYLDEELALTPWLGAFPDFAGLAIGSRCGGQKHDLISP